ncbi:hypothetical protein PBY51_013787 [Eleginops maclovinus]|uniref:Uncharacterized protein n=1 Tax=Eleginops maclovinus TaxID=56733 RepID=A0AAN8AUR0_ELEMC|nr:hypothetical protein PBY51_013787 [Eleginops maclovinus]
MFGFRLQFLFLLTFSGATLGQKPGSPLERTDVDKTNSSTEGRPLKTNPDSPPKRLLLFDKDSRLKGFIQINKGSPVGKLIHFNKGVYS